MLSTIVPSGPGEGACDLANPPERGPCHYGYSRACWRRPRPFARGARGPSETSKLAVRPTGGFEDLGEE